MGKFDFLIERLRTQTQEERLQVLKKAGIIDANNELADMYCTKRQLREKKKRLKCKI